MMNKNTILILSSLTLLVLGLYFIYTSASDQNKVSNYTTESAQITIIDLDSQNNSNVNHKFIGGALIFIAFIIIVASKYSSEEKNPIPEFTKREKDVVSQIREGKTNKEIAAELNLSLSTVKTHVNNIFKKTNVSTKAELLKFFNS